MTGQWWFWIISLPILFVIIFVKAGQGGSSKSGGEQSKLIISSIGTSGSSLISALEGNPTSGSTSGTGL